MDDGEPSVQVMAFESHMLAEQGSQLKSVAELALEIKKQFKAQQKTFDAADDDWQQFVVFQCSNGEIHLIVIDDLLDWPLKKMLAEEIVPHIIEKADAHVFGFAFNAWMIEPDDVLEGVAIRDNPKRREALQIVAADRLGNVATLMAFILRTDKEPPTLGPWDTNPSDGAMKEAMRSQGPMADPMIAAMRKRGQSLKEQL